MGFCKFVTIKINLDEVKGFFCGREIFIYIYTPPTVSEGLVQVTNLIFINTHTKQFHYIPLGNQVVIYIHTWKVWSKFVPDEFSFEELEAKLFLFLNYFLTVNTNSPQSILFVKLLLSLLHKHYLHFNFTISTYQKVDNSLLRWI